MLRSILALVLTALPAAALDCSAVDSVDLPDVRIEKVEAQGEADVPYCLAEGFVGDEIGFAMVLPEKSAWNGKLYMAGVGGFAGSYNARALNAALAKGYAGVITDTGHHASGIRADWAVDNLERRVNYGYLGVHRTAVTAKALVDQVYGAPPEYSYFGGCSNGGRQAMMEAQRYPNDFDGIIAGAPAHNFTGVLGGFVYNIQRIFPDPDKLDDPVITEHNRKLLQSTILERCDKNDGVQDNVLNDPRTCGFQVSDLPVCAGGEPAPHCVTIAQREAIAAVYEGPRNQDGQIFPGFPLGGEAERGGWDAWITGPNPGLMRAYGEPSSQYGFGTQGFQYLVGAGPDWDYSTYDFTTFHEDIRELGSYTNAVDPDLSAFRDAGGKLILWHGWADPALTAYESINYWEAAGALDPQMDDYFRFYLLPGVLHCSGGPGADRVDWLTALEDWVERGQSPGRLTAARVRDGETTMTRPVCVYPERATYDGAGDPNQAPSFSCRAP